MTTSPVITRNGADLSRRLGYLATIITILVGAVSLKEHFDRRPKFNLSGRWIIEDKIDKTAYKPYLGGTAMFSVAINQTGTDFSGVGEKTMQAAHELVGRERSSLSIQGHIDGDKVTATFLEKGNSRETSGFFLWTFDPAQNRWVGTFSSTAADTSGSSILRR